MNSVLLSIIGASYITGLLTLIYMRPSSMNVTFYQDQKGEWRWRCIAKNKKIIGASTEGYQNKNDAYDNAELLYNSLVK